MLLFGGVLASGGGAVGVVMCGAIFVLAGFLAGFSEMRMLRGVDREIGYLFLFLFLCLFVLFWFCCVAEERRSGYL